MLEVRDPADVRSVVAEVPAMSVSEVAAAYTRARAGFDAWRRVNPLDRAAVLARAEGAVVITGGDWPAAAPLEYGCYVSPTIISMDTKHSLWREEVFGPVVAVRFAW